MLASGWIGPPIPCAAPGPRWVDLGDLLRHRALGASDPARRREPRAHRGQGLAFKTHAHHVGLPLGEPQRIGGIREDLARGTVDLDPVHDRRHGLLLRPASCPTVSMLTRRIERVNARVGQVTSAHRAFEHVRDLIAAVSDNRRPKPLHQGAQRRRPVPMRRRDAARPLAAVRRRGDRRGGAAFAGACHRCVPEPARARVLQQCAARGRLSGRLAERLDHDQRRGLAHDGFEASCRHHNDRTMRRRVGRMPMATSLSIVVSKKRSRHMPQMTAMTAVRSACRAADSAAGVERLPTDL